MSLVDLEIIALPFTFKAYGLTFDSTKAIDSNKSLGMEYCFSARAISDLSSAAFDIFADDTAIMTTKRTLFSLSVALINGIIDLYKLKAVSCMNWIKERLNRDNFWNLVFGLSFISGWTMIGFIGEDHPNINFVISWLMILGIPASVTIANRVTFTEEKIFLNKVGMSLEGRYPKNLFFLIALTIGLPVLVGLTMDRHFRDIDPMISNFMLLFLLFMTPTLYFIYRNCPISILFNRKAWRSEVPGVERGYVNGRKPYEHTTPLSTQMAHHYKYRYLSGNYYNRNR